MTESEYRATWRLWCRREDRYGHRMRLGNFVRTAWAEDVLCRAWLGAPPRPQAHMPVDPLTGDPL